MLVCEKEMIFSDLYIGLYYNCKETEGINYPPTKNSRYKKTPALTPLNICESVTFYFAQMAISFLNIGLNVNAGDISTLFLHRSIGRLWRRTLFAVTFYQQKRGGCGCLGSPPPPGYVPGVKRNKISGFYPQD